MTYAYAAKPTPQEYKIIYRRLEGKGALLPEVKKFIESYAVNLDGPSYEEEMKQLMEGSDPTETAYNSKKMPFHVALLFSDYIWEYEDGNNFYCEPTPYKPKYKYKLCGIPVTVKWHELCPGSTNPNIRGKTMCPFKALHNHILYSNNNFNSPGHYKLFSNNCQHFVAYCIKYLQEYEDDEDIEDDDDENNHFDDDENNRFDDDENNHFDDEENNRFDDDEDIENDDDDNNHFDDEENNGFEDEENNGFDDEENNHFDDEENNRFNDDDDDNNHFDDDDENNGFDDEENNRFNDDDDNNHFDDDENNGFEDEENNGFDDEENNHFDDEENNRFNDDDDDDNNGFDDEENNRFNDDDENNSYEYEED